MSRRLSQLKGLRGDDLRLVILLPELRELIRLPAYRSWRLSELIRLPAYRLVKLIQQNVLR